MRDGDQPNARAQAIAAAGIDAVQAIESAGVTFGFPVPTPPRPSGVELGRRLRDLRRRGGFSYAGLATQATAALGDSGVVDQGDLQLLELATGWDDFGARELDAVLAVLGTTMADFMGEETT
ncbi:MAG: hypothetical protein AAGN66_05525 [Acidobacteriota bacterium]